MQNSNGPIHVSNIQCTLLFLDRNQMDSRLIADYRLKGTKSTIIISNAKYENKYKQIAFRFNEQDQNLGDGHENLPVNI